MYTAGPAIGGPLLAVAEILLLTQLNSRLLLGLVLAVVQAGLLARLGTTELWTIGVVVIVGGLVYIGAVIAIFLMVLAAGGDRLR